MHRANLTDKVLRSCFGAIHKKSTPSKLLDWTLEELARAQRDLDITGDIDSAYYYEGFVDALEMVALWIAPLKVGKEPVFYELLGKVFSKDKAS